MITVEELADALGGGYAGDGSLELSGPAEPASASPDQIALAMDPKYAAALSQGEARCAILWPGADWQEYGLDAAIFAPRPRYVLSGVTRVFDPVSVPRPGIHPTAVIASDVQLPSDTYVGPLVVIESGVKIGAGARIHSHVSIGQDTEIGEGALLHSGVRIGARIRIGDRFIAQPGCVVGGDGFSFVTPQPGIVEEARATGAVAAEDQSAYVRINSLGSVVIGDDVELGANACIDRGTIADTTIGDGTKIDNLVQIGHNVRIGSTCLVCGHVAVGGSTVIGDRVVLGGRAAVADHLTIGANSVITGNSGVASNVPPNRVMMGYPAVRMDQNVEMYKALRRLPRALEKLAKAEK
ncbi:UDP-3-O-(3-hydroxymyristoyl)glucosamine N-acyltransferase [Amaricoccus macauensis]|uniref:UDP-3-O-(3-hydroxymyristoyl)glucosamine N-acyltransferase n=1 Tax=Amaricoccus macauensis TaxID=57001 RepID=UPI003C7D7F55